MKILEEKDEVKLKRMNVEGFADAAVLANRIFLDALLLCVFDSASEKEAFVKKLPTIESQLCG